MKRFLLTLCLFPLVLFARDPAPETTLYSRREIQLILEQIKQWYASGDPESQQMMAQALEELAQRSPEGELNPDAVKLARSMALLKTGNPEEALKVLDEIEGFEQAEPRAQVRQMKGNGQMQMAEKAVSEQDWKNAKAQMQAAIDSFSNALREDGTQDDARFNLELASKRLEEIKALEPPPPPEQDKQDQEKQEDKQDQEDKKDQQQQQDQQQDQQQQQDSSGEKDQEQQQQDQQDQNDQQQDQGNDQQPQQDQASQPEQSNESPAGTSEGEPSEAEKIDARQAQQILQSALEQEKRQRRQIQLQRIKPVPVEKDW